MWQSDSKCDKITGKGSDPVEKRKAALVCCSNALPPEAEEIVSHLQQILLEHGTESVRSACMFSELSWGHGTARERAEALMAFYEDPGITDIYDISGGDIANELLPYLDYDLIRRSAATFYGYSDLTVMLNAVFAKTGREGILWQVRNLVRNRSTYQCRRFRDGTLFDFDYRFVQGSYMEGIVVGGNIRCFLKLAGTPYFPDLTGKILLLEAQGGEVPQMMTYISQLTQLGAFDKIKGVILGTFTKMEQEGCEPSVEQLLQQAAPDLPVVKTAQIGHGSDSAAVRIGGFYRFRVSEKQEKF